MLSTECAMEGSSSLSSTISASLVTLFSPFILMVVVQLFFLVYWLYLRQQYAKSWRYFVSRAVLTAITSIFFAYSNVTEELMSTMNCVTLDRGRPDDDDIPPQHSMYSTAQNTFWVQNTSLLCFEDEHRFLAYLVGIPGLVLFTVGIPVGLLVFLVSKKEMLYTPAYLNTYGFVYEAYVDDHMYWEVLTMARKALVAAIVVFGYSLGPNLQGVLALGVLIVALVMQIVVRPYKYDRLNDLEGTSLVVTMITLYSGLVFEEENTNTGGRAVMSVIVLILNVGLVVILLFEVYMNLDKYCDAKIEHYGGRIPTFGGLPMKMYTLAMSVVKNHVTNVGPHGQGGMVQSTKRFIARSFGWTIVEPKNSGTGRLPQESMGGPVGDVEKDIGPIPEERSSEISASLSLPTLKGGLSSNIDDRMPSSTPISGRSNKDVSGDDIAVDLVQP